jgi:polysaccharide biosynthesis/export protein
MTIVVANMPALSKRVFQCVAALAICSLAVLPLQAAVSIQTSEYRLDIGDVMELSIMGMPELKVRIPVDLNGDASFPLIGEVKVIGMKLSELRVQIRERIPQFVYKNRTVASSDGSQIIEANEISLRILEYRPVYLSGDITRQGEVAYRPGLTVRQAVTIAGGYNLLGAGNETTVVDTIELQNRHASAAISFAKEKARVWRLQNVLGRQVAINRSEFPQSLSPDVLNQIIDLETEHLKIAQNDYEVEKNNLVKVIATAEQRIINLTAQAKSEEEGARLDAEDMDRVNELFKKNLVPASRVTDVRRAALLSSSRAQQTSVAADNAAKDREEAMAKLQRLLLTRRIVAAGELEEANAKMEALRGELDTSKKKLLLAGTSGATLVRARAADMQIWIFRKNGSDQVRIVGEEDTELLPGDVVEVNLGLDSPVNAAQAVDVLK